MARFSGCKFKRAINFLAYLPNHRNPKFSLAFIALNVYVWWFITIACIAEKAVNTYS